MEEKMSRLESKLRDLTDSEEAIGLALNAVGKTISHFPRDEYGEKVDINYFGRGAAICMGIFETFGDIKGRKILDIGCGASPFEKVIDRGGLDQIGVGGWEPWISRTLNFAGADVTGIDLRESRDEPYRHITANLTYQTLEGILPNQKFDAAIAMEFFNSPRLEINGVTPESFEERVCGGVYNILKDGGIFLIKPYGFIGFDEENGRKMLTQVGFEMLRDIRSSGDGLVDPPIWKKTGYKT